MIMIDLIAFIFSCLIGVGVGDETTGAKRKDISPLAKMNVKKLKEATTDEVNKILERTSIEREIKRLKKFRFETIREFLDHHGVDFDAAEATGMYGQLSQDSIKENILVELSLMEE